MPIVAVIVGGLAGLIAGWLTPSDEAGVPGRVSPGVITAIVGFTIAQTYFWLGRIFPKSIDKRPCLCAWERVAPATGHTGGVWALSFSPDGRLLASGSADRAVRVWDVTHGVELMVLSGYTSDMLRVAFSRDGRALASAESVVWVWGVR